MKINKKVVAWSIGFFVLGLLLSPTKTVEVIKKVPVNTVATAQDNCIQKDCDCDELTVLYDQVFVLNSEAFEICASYIELIPLAAQAGMTMDLNEIERITGVIKSNTDKMNKLTNEVTVLSVKIQKLKN